MYMVLLMVVIANNPKGDMCRAGYGFHVLYQKSLFREFLGWAVLIYSQGRQFWLYGATPTRASLGVYRLTFYLTVLGWSSRRALNVVVLRFCFKIFLEFVGLFQGSSIYVVFHLALDEFKRSYWIVLEEMTALLLIVSIAASLFWRRRAVFLP